MNNPQNNKPLDLFMMRSDFHQAKLINNATSYREEELSEEPKELHYLEIAEGYVYNNIKR